MMLNSASCKIWQKQKLGCLFSFHRSLSASRAQLGEIGIPYLHYGDIHKTGKTSFDPEKDELPKLDYRENAERYLLKNGDIVFVDASEDRKDVSRFCVIKNKNDIPFLAGLHTVVARPTSSELNINFSEFLFQSDDFKRQVSILANGMKVFGVSKDILSNIVIHYPENTTEQEKIAEILGTWDSAIEKLTALIAAKCLQKKGLMQKLLTAQIRLPGFTGEWQKQTLGCLFSFHHSLSASRAQLGGIGIPYLHYGDIHKTGKTSFNPETDELPKLDYRENAEKYLLKNGDVVFVDASEDRKDASRFCVIKNKNNVPFLAGLHTVVARPKSDELNVDFSEFLFQSNDFRKQVSILANGMKIFGVSKDILSNIVIQYPQNIVEQKAIADILSKADEEIDLLTRKLDLIQSQKKGLMQQLLTGKIRVKVA